jgi:dihydropteroate synthase
MLSLQSLAELFERYPGAFDHHVSPVIIGEKVIANGDGPAIMGTINLSRDSTYRESIATGTESAIRKARVMAAQGAHFVDIGAESSTAAARRVNIDQQIDALVPVIKELSEDGIAVSAETYEPEVAHACLEAGAEVINFTGSEHSAEIFAAVAKFDATLILCYVGGANVREITDVSVDEDPIPGLRDFFDERTKAAQEAGVSKIIIDPGMGFYYGNLVDPKTRVRHQTKVILNSFRLRELGFPICQALPHAFDLFEDQFRTAEGFFAVLASLGGVGVFRTHEVAQVRAVSNAMRLLSAN